MLKFFSKRMNNKKGFTLIELIVVIAILGILAVIAIPRLAGLQGNANQKTVIANLKTLDNAILTHAAEKNIEATAVTSNDIVGSGKLIETIPSGPSGVSYEIPASTGYAQAKVPASAGIPGLTDGATLKLNADGTLSGNE